MLLKFLGFTLDPERGSLQTADRDIKLRPKTFDVLCLLLLNAGRLVHREELLSTLWPGVIVNEESITQCVSELRQALGDREHKIIKTIARRGYLFAAHVETITFRDVADVHQSMVPAESSARPVPLTQQESGRAPIYCAKCGTANTPAERTCFQCGASVIAPDFSVSPRGPERRQVTILTCNVFGSAPAHLDPEDLREVMSTCHGCVRGVVERYGGYVAQCTANGFLANFGYPHAREDDVERAVRAGLAVAIAVGGLKIEKLAEGLRARVGIATGLVVVGDTISNGQSVEHVLVGETPLLATRLASLAGPNAVVVSASTRRLLGGLFEIHHLGDGELQGSVDASQVLGEAIRGRFEALRGSDTSPLVGREEELDLLMRRWEQAKTGSGRVVLLTGEAGIGKSRMAKALQDRLAAQPHTPLIYHCSPHHQDTSLHPIIAQLVRASRIERNDSAEARLAKLEALMAKSALPSTEHVALLAALLSLPGGERYPLPTLTPRQIKERTFGVLLDQLRLLCAKQPVLVVFEDLQWIDPTSLELLTHLVEQAVRFPFLLVGTARPEWTPPWPNHSHTSIVALTRLGRPDVENLIASVVRGKTLPPEVLTQIVARTDGVPLFIEELTKTLLESGIMRDAGGRYELTGPLPSRSIPSTLHASLLARLDRLGSVKDIAQVGAAIGGEFAHGLIAAVSTLPEQILEAGLAQLVAAELIFQRGVPPDASYRFKHALVQDAAYNTLLRSRRQQLHAQIAHGLEEQFPNIVATAPETLAHHFAEAGLTGPAIEYWGRAGERALGRSANAEAVKHLTKGIELTRSLPVSVERHRRELALQMPLGPAMMALKGAAAPETVQIFSRARELLTEDATLAEQMNVLMGLWLSRGVSGDLAGAREVAQQCLSLATQHQHAGAEARANRYVGQTRLMMGELVEARRHLERTLELCDAHQAIVLHFLDDNRVHALSQLGWTLWLLGYPDQSAAAVSSARAAAKDVDHAVTTAMAFIAEAKLGTVGGDPERAAACADSALAVCIEHGLADWENWARFFQGELLAQRGEPQRGIVVMRNALAALDRIGAKQSRAMHFGGLAAAHISLREFDVGLGLLDQAIQIADKTAERVSQAELHRLRGEVLTMTNRRDEAQVELEQALAVARRQDARFWELRAATTLARLWRDRGHCREASDLLSPLCEWFSEGLELPDLKIARTLLDELARA